MKQTLTDIFDRADPRELDLLLPNALEGDSLDQTALARIRTAASADIHPLKPAARRPLTQRGWRLPAAAACVALFLTAGLASCAEAREYDQAVRFFDDYHLSTQGLSRGEIKAVYRDITTKSFTYSRTAQVIEDSLWTEVGGFAIPQNAPTVTNMAQEWNYMDFDQQGAWGTPGIHYEYRSQSRYDDSRDTDIYDRGIFEKYDGEELVWSVSLPDLHIGGYAPVSGGILLYGKSFGHQLHMLDHDGVPLWTQSMPGSVRAAVDNGDGTYGVFIRDSDLSYRLLQLDARGGVLSSHDIHSYSGTYGLWNAVRLGEGYLVQFGSYVEGDYAHIIKLDRDGTLVESFAYEGEDCHYYITDMIEFNGCVYLSAYATPKTEEAYGREEIAWVLDYLFDNSIFEITSQELTPLLRDNYTAVLLVCGPDGGAPREFYSVDGSMGGKLSVSGDGELLWKVESITSSFHSPATSAFTLGGICYVYQYTFDRSGGLVSQEKTGEVVRYSR